MTMTDNPAMTIRLDGDCTEHERELVRRAVSGALAARDEQWRERVHEIQQLTGQAVADALHTYYTSLPSTYTSLPSTSTATDGQRAAELALDVIRQSLPDVFATVEKSVREATIVRAPDGQIQSVITRTIDADAA